MQATRSEHSYSLRLDSILSWRLIANEGSATWLKQLASIMNLASDKSQNVRKITFVMPHEEDRSFRRADAHPPLSGSSDLPRDGWKIDDLGALLVWSHSKVTHVVCELSEARTHDVNILTMGQAVFPIYQAAIEGKGLPLHAALIECKGKGILIAGNGGTGKTTCCRRAPRPWKALCDDETLVVHSESELYKAHPFPTWSDYLWRRSEHKWNVQRWAPVSAIFFLEQDGNDKVFPIGEAVAAARIMQSARQVCQRMWQRLEIGVQRENNLRLFDNACILAKAVPSFTLCASVTGRFWKNIEKVL